MSVKIKWHLNWNVAKTEVSQNWNNTKTETLQIDWKEQKKYKIYWTDWSDCPMI